MTDTAFDFARFARRLLSDKADARATAADHARSRSLLLCEDAQAAAPAPRQGLTLVELLQFYLGSTTFEHWMVSAAMSRRKPGLSETVPAADLSWARKRLPLTDATRTAFQGSLTRGQLLSALFSDLAFLEAVHAGRSWNWPASVFLPAATPGRETRRFMQGLLSGRSSLISRVTLARWGLDGALDVDELFRYGGIPGFRANDLFDADFYAQGDGRSFDNHFDALRHYVEVGEPAGADPNPFLNSRLYLQNHPDLLAEIKAGRLICYLEHMLQRDAVEHRSAAVHFDAAFYGTQTTQKAVRRFGSPFAHYVNEGWKEGLDPNPCFDAVWYLRAYPDALASVREGRRPNAFAHFVMEGEAAGYRPHPFVDPAAYAAANADIADNKAITPFRHFWQQGRFEGREYGLPATRPLARFFHRRLPDSLDGIEDGVLVRLPGTPAEVLRRASAPANGADLVSVLQNGPDDGGRSALKQALFKLGRPRIAVEVGRQQQMHAGDVTRLYISGLAGFGTLPLKSMRVISDIVDGDCAFFRYHRLEDVEAVSLLGGTADDLKAGFMAWFEVSTRSLMAGTEHLDIQFTFGDPQGGEEVTTHETIHLDIHARPVPSTAKARIQVAMAVYNPPARPFAAQVDSILENRGTHLLISDDCSPVAGARVLSGYDDRPRIDIDSNSRNLGFICNFERSLYMRSDAAETLLFSDQDDVWRSDKVKTLAQMLKPGVSCAFSDMRIVTGDGEVISETFWTGRRVHHADPLTLGVANTVTGAASAFPTWLADVMTPFPRYSDIYHDQWLSVVAAASGEVAYTSRPLYDYVQHGANVLGYSGSRSGGEARWAAVSRRLRSAARRRVAEDADLALVEMALAETVPLLQRFVLLHEALVRVPVWHDPRVQDIGRRMSDAIRGEPFDARALLRDWRRLARRAGGAFGLLNIDDIFISILTARALVARGIATPRALTEMRDGRRSAWAAKVAAQKDVERSDYERKVEAFRPEPAKASGEGLRLNLFLPELQLSTFFGGYHSKISLITRLEARGIRTRLVLVDQPAVDYDGVSRIVGAFPELETGLMRSEIFAMGARDRALPLTDRDALLATTWWSAHIVNDLRAQLKRDRFLYFIQEFEPFTFPLGTWYRGAEATYDFPHDAVFSTEILQDYFAKSGIGVFGQRAAPDAQALAFRNPITGLNDLKRQPKSSRVPRLLFYARPQPHAARNMYEFGAAALRLVAQSLGEELDGWDIVGVGASENAKVKLGAGRELRLISKLDSEGYRRMLATSDVGLALMYTPHPSLVPLEMASAGLVTVTNACMTKTRESLAGISDLIDVAEPEVEAIAASLVAAIRRVNAGPVLHRPIDWPVDPRGAFPDAWLDRFVALAERSLKPG